MAFVERVFSGVQPTGNLHLGNYLGAIVNFVKMQETHNCIYCVVDMHALTQGLEVWGGPTELARLRIRVAVVSGLVRRVASLPAGAWACMANASSPEMRAVRWSLLMSAKVRFPRGV